MPRTLSRGLAALAAIVLLATGCGGDDKPEPLPTLSSGQVAQQTASVAVADDEYRPSEVFVVAGGAVIWTYEGPSGNHTVTGEGFDSNPECPSNFNACMSTKNDTFAFTFDTPGRFAYRCKIHGDEGMTGTVLVVAQ